MAGFLSKQRRGFVLAVGGVIMLALLPAAWLDRYLHLSDVAELAGVVIQPFSHPAGVVRVWLRPPADPLAGDSPRLKELTEQIETYRAALAAERNRVERLRDQIAELEAARRFTPGLDFVLVYAQVTGSKQSRSGGMIRLNRGSRWGVGGGTVAVRGGGDLLGRVAEGQLSRVSCWLMPITDPSIGRVEARVFAGDQQTLSVETAGLTLLSPTGDGTLTGDVRSSAGVERGDEVRLFDEAWQATAQGMIIGIVESVQRKDQQPKRYSIIVRPRYNPYRLASMTLKILRDSSDDNRSIPEDDQP